METVISGFKGEKIELPLSKIHVKNGNQYDTVIPIIQQEKNCKSRFLIINLTIRRIQVERSSFTINYNQEKNNLSCRCFSQRKAALSSQKKMS